MDSRDIPEALAQPTRARLFSLLQEFGRPVPTSELAERLGLHPNGVRIHLETLSQAGLIERGRSSNRRGRPRDEWIISSRSGEGPTADHELARWLARAMPSGRGDLQAIESAGRGIGLELELPETDDSRHRFVGVINRLGFEATVEVGDDQTGFTCRLGNCPYRSAVHENQEAVCALHRGITRGLLESVDSRFNLTEFAPRDPDQAGCVIGVEVS